MTRARPYRRNLLRSDDPETAGPDAQDPYEQETQEDPHDAETRVLILEDDPVFAKMLTRILESASDHRYACLTAHTLKRGLQALREDAYDVVVADLGLPDSRDYQTVESLNEAAPEVPIVVLTGTAESGVDRSLEAVRRGAAYFLRKGNLDATAVERGIRYAIGRHQLQNILRGEP